MSIDSEGNLYGADSFGGRVTKLKPRAGADNRPDGVMRGRPIERDLLHDFCATLRPTLLLPPYSWACAVVRLHVEKNNFRERVSTSYHLTILRER